MNQYRNTALHNAAGQGDVAALRRLLAGPASANDALGHKALDIEGIGKGGWTPLEVAVYKGHFEAVAFLLEAGAVVRPRAVQLAREYRRPRILGLLARTSRSDAPGEQSKE